MKIVFWGIDCSCETTQNMNALIGLLNREHPDCKIRMFRKKKDVSNGHLVRRKDSHTLDGRKKGRESNGELLFYDCGNQTDGAVRKQIREADLVVINMPQYKSAWERLLLDPVVCAEHAIFVIGNYFETSALNREEIEKLYRIGADRLGVIPYNNEFHYAAEQGTLTKFIRDGMGENQKNLIFERELGNTLRLMLNRLVV